MTKRPKYKIWNVKNFKMKKQKTKNSRIELIMEWQRLMLTFYEKKWLRILRNLRNPKKTQGV